MQRKEKQGKKKSFYDSQSIFLRGKFFEEELFLLELLLAHLICEKYSTIVMAKL
jgi:hypothetical protein